MTLFGQLPDVTDYGPDAYPIYGLGYKYGFGGLDYGYTTHIGNGCGFGAADELYEYAYGYGYGNGSGLGQDGEEHEH